MTGSLILMLGACQGPQYITDDPTILLNYQKDPTMESLTDLSKSYLNTINQNRKQGKVQPGLYCDYAVTLYLLGKPEAAEGWFNKEVSTFPYTATYVKQLRDDLDVRLNGADPNRNHHYTVDDVNNMDDIAVLRPTENREASKLTKESEQEADRISRDAVKGLDKPLTKEEKKALKAQQRENRRQEKAAESSKFTAPGQRAEEQQAKVKAKEEKRAAAAQKKEEQKRLRAEKKAMKENAVNNEAKEEHNNFLSKLKGKNAAKKDSQTIEEEKTAKKDAKKLEKTSQKEGVDAEVTAGKSGKKAKESATVNTTKEANTKKDSTVKENQTEKKVKVKKAKTNTTKKDKSDSFDEKAFKEAFKNTK